MASDTRSKTARSSQGGLVDIARLRDKYDHRPGVPGAVRERDADGYLVARVPPPERPDRSTDVEQHLLQRRDQDQLSELRAQADRASSMREEIARRPVPTQAKRGTTISAAVQRGNQRRSQSVSVSVPTVSEPALSIEGGGSMVPEGYVPLVSDDPGTEMWSRGLQQNHVIVKMDGKFYAVPRGQKSDERSKQAIQAVRAAPGYEYEYKPEHQGPGAPPGRHVGPMAQDLEKTPMGKQMVSEGPNGMKQIDTARLPLLNTAALHDIDSRLRKLEGGR